MKTKNKILQFRCQDSENNYWESTNTTSVKENWPVAGKNTQLYSLLAGIDIQQWNKYHELFLNNPNKIVVSFVSDDMKENAILVEI